jgi:alkanesulfonate monooxygenase SsuD/methylene tetrahydromethanopterin reductase-like flavin-dependent oxidoreductase (luciferase family)
MHMKVRIGIGTGGPRFGGGELEAITDAIVELGFDSLWLPEVLTAPSIDPLVGLSWAAAYNRRIKIGTTMLLPGRNVVRLAKSLASLDVLSEGRLLVTFVPGVARGPERSALGVAPSERSAVIDDALPVLRRLWAGETVTHRGPAGSLEQVALPLLPRQDPWRPGWAGWPGPPSSAAGSWRTGGCRDCARSPRPPKGARSSRNRQPVPAGTSAPSTSASRSPMPRHPSVRTPSPP